MRSSVLGTGVVVGALFAAGCGQELGTTVSAGKNECVPMQTKVDLAPTKRVFVSGDIQFGGSDDEEGVANRIQLRNIGRGVLEVSSDVGSLSYANSAFSTDQPGTIDFNVGQGDTDGLMYRQADTDAHIVPAIGMNHHISLQLNISCK